MENVTLKINGQEVTVPKNYTVMQAADKLGIDIPRLCFLKDVNETSACRLCVVDVKNMRGLKNSCTLAITDGMELETDSEEIHDSIVANLQLLASNHVFECWACEREHNCELLDLMRRFNVDNVYGENNHFYKKDRQINDESTSIVLDSGKCILCGRCVSACDKFTGLGILDFNERGNETYVGPALFHSMADSGCISCGKCIQACPVAAIKEKSHIDEVLDAVKNRNKKVIGLIDPLVNVSLGEEFNCEFGENVEGKLLKSLQLIGFDEILNASLSTDLTVIEESTELIKRLKDNAKLPLFSSTSAGWVNYIEQYETDFLNHMSTVKSPQQTAGVVAKHYYAEKLGYNKEDVVFVSITPSVAKKDEAARPTMEFDGVRDVDYVLTTREYARLLKRKGLNFMKLEDTTPVGELYNLTSTENEYGVANSILEATLHTASEILEEKPQSIEFKQARGTKGIKEATYKLAGNDINVAIVEGAINFKEFFVKMKKSKKVYHYVEFIANDGGQPIQSAKIQDTVDIKNLRLDALQASNKVREEGISFFNNKVTELYNNFFTEPGSAKSQQLLHTTYNSRKFFK